METLDETYPREKSSDTMFQACETDISQIFKWLRERKVKKILKIKVRLTPVIFFSSMYLVNVPAGYGRR